MAKRPQIPPEERNRLIKLIHIAKKQLGMDRDEYETVLAAATGKTSCSQMSDREVNAVYRRMIALGFTVGGPKAKPEAKPRQVYSPKYASDSQEAKLVALWITAYQRGLVEDRSHDALLSYVWKGQEQVTTMPGVDRLVSAPWKLKQDRIQGLEEMIQRAKAKETQGGDKG